MHRYTNYLFQLKKIMHELLEYDINTILQYNRSFGNSQELYRPQLGTQIWAKVAKLVVEYSYTMTDTR